MPSQITTTDATPATLWTARPVDGTAQWYEAVVTARQSGTENVAAYVRYVFARRTATMPATSIVGSVGAPFTAENVAGWDAIFAVSGTDVVLRVTGAAASTIVWTLQSMRSHGEPLGTSWDAT